MHANRTTRRLLTRAVAGALLAVVTAGPLAAQSAVDTAAAVGLLVTPAGALPAPASGTLGGATSAGVGLSALYGYLDGRPARGLFTTGAGGRLDLRLPGGALNLSATAGRRLASCPAGPRSAAEAFLDVECHDLWMAGAGVTMRLVRADVTDDLSFATSCLTVSVDATGGVADEELGRLRSDWRSAAARSATLGLAVALATQFNGATVVPFITPTLAWAHVNTRRIAPRIGGGAVVGADTIAFDHEGERLALAGGVAVLGTRSGVGFHLTAQTVAVRGGRVAVGAAISLASPWGRRDRALGRGDEWGGGGAFWERHSLCRELSGR
jgi:hypothetical protein